MDKEKQLELLKSDLIIAQNKLNDIQKNFIALSDELEKEKKSVWKPYEQGFSIEGTGYIGKNNHNTKPNDHNCFRTKELAELRYKQRQAEDELFNIWESLVGDWRPDWNDKDQKKFCFRTLSGREDWTDYYVQIIDRPPYRYFPTEKLAMKQYEMASEHAKAYIRGEF